MPPRASNSLLPAPSTLAGAWWRVLAGCAVAGAMFLRAAGAEPAKEYQVKAAFLYNFTRFVEWPGLRGGDAPIVIGVLGRNPFGDELEKVIHDRKVNGHAIVVVHLTTAVDAGPLQAVFVPAGEEKRLEREVAALHRAGVLTVGESDRFSALGGVITFATVDDKVRFAINMPAADAAGLKISAQLQKLASTSRRVP